MVTGSIGHICEWKRLKCNVNTYFTRKQGPWGQVVCFKRYLWSLWSSKNPLFPKELTLLTTIREVKKRTKRVNFPRKIAKKCMFYSHFIRWSSRSARDLFPDYTFKCGQNEVKLRTSKSDPNPNSQIWSPKSQNIKSCNSLVKTGYFMSNSLGKSTIFHFFDVLMGRSRQMSQKVIQDCFVRYFGCFLTQLGDPSWPNLTSQKACFKYVS